MQGLAKIVILLKGPTKTCLPVPGQEIAVQCTSTVRIPVQIEMAQYEYAYIPNVCIRRGSKYAYIMDFDTAKAMYLINPLFLTVGIF